MPALPPVPNTLRFALRSQQNVDVDILYILHFLYSGGTPGTADVASFCDDIMTSWASHMAAQVSVDISLLSVRGIDLSSSIAAEGDSTHSAVPGTRGGHIQAAGACVLIDHKITRRYRGGKPRTYISGTVIEDLVDAQTWTSAYVNGTAAAWDAFIAGVVGSVSGTTTLGNAVSVSYYHGNSVVISPTTGRARNVPQLRSSPIVDGIISNSVNPRVASQRRRNEIRA